MKRLAIIYDRASRKEQKGNWSRDDALRIGGELANRYDYTSELRQEVKSGETLEDRPVMMGILEDIEAGTVGAIIVQDFTRLSRDEDGIDGKIIRRFCRDNECKVITPQKVYDFSLDVDDDMADLEFFIGKIHKRQTVKALVRGMQEKARQGKHITGFTLMGYDRVYDPPKDPSKRPVGRLVINENEAEVICLVFHKYLELGSATRAATWLNIHSYRKPVKSTKMRERYGLGETRLFTNGDVIRIIQNPLYAGWATWGKECKSRQMRNFEAQWHYRSEWQIVSQDIWDRANDLSKRNARTPARAVGSRYAFSLLLACKCCGGSLVGTSVLKSTGRHKKYRCQNRNKSGRAACETGQTINETVVARALLPLAARLIEQGLNLKVAIQKVAQGISQKTDKVLEQNWRAELAEVERETKNLVRAVAKGVVTDDQARDVNQELVEKKQRLERNLAKLREKAEIQRELLEAIPAISDDIEGTLRLFLEKRPTTLNQILGLIFQRHSVVVEAWGPPSKRQSRVVSYRLTEAFADALKVSSEQGSRSSWRLPAR
jgi:hypothetical protein